jgi:hypothetical protein
MKKVTLVLSALVLLLVGMVFVGCEPSSVDPPPPPGEGIVGGNLPSDGKLGLGIVGSTAGWNGSEEKALSLDGNPGGVGFGIDISGALTGTITLNIIYKTPKTMALLTPPDFDGNDDTIPGTGDEGKTVLTLKGVKLAITTDNSKGSSPGESDFTAAKTIGDIPLKAHWWIVSGGGSELEADPLTLAAAFNTPPTITSGHWTMQLQYDGVEVDPQWIE